MPESTRGSSEIPSNSPIRVVGSINIDLTLRTGRLPRPGETVLGTTLQHGLGGKGANQAVAAARLTRQSVEFVGMIGGDDEGAFVQRLLAREANLVPTLHQTDRYPTGCALIMVDAQGENLIGVYSGANAAWTEDLMRATFPTPCGDADTLRSRVLLTNGELPIRAVVVALQTAKQLGWTTVFNPAPMPAPDAMAALLPWTDVLTPNAHEASQLVGRTVHNVETARTAARQIAFGGPATVVVTLGEQGAVSWHQGASVVVPAPQVPVVDTTGAGDALNGALCVALSEGLDPQAAVAFAVRAASLSVGHRGAQEGLPTREQLHSD